MVRSVTVKDVAERADVSIATVSRVLNNQGNINEEMRLRVIKVASELGYNKSVSQNAPVRSNEHVLKEIHFLFNAGNSIEKTKLDPFWAPILHGAESEARKLNSKMLYHGIGQHYLPSELLTKLQETSTSGILLVGPARLENVQALFATTRPMVLVDNFVSFEGLRINAVLSDSFEGTREAVKYLIREGHQHIAFVGGYTPLSPKPYKVYTFERRKDGYLSALREAGLTIHEALIETCDVDDPEDVLAACQRLLATQLPISAIFCANDPTASWVMKALQALGRRIPEDVSVVGFDDADLAEHLTPALTTMRVNREAMGSMAVKSLLARATDPQAICTTTLLGVELIRRSSVSFHTI